MTEKLVKILEEKGGSWKSIPKKEKSTVKKKKVDSTLTIEDRVNTKLKLDAKSKVGNIEKLKKSRSTQKKQKSCSFIRAMR